MSNLTPTQQAAIDQAKWQLEEACKLAASIGPKYNVGLGDGSSVAKAVLVQTAADLIAHAWYEKVLTQVVSIDGSEEEPISTQSATK